MSAPKFSLSFSKRIEKKTLQPSAIRNDAPAEIRDKTENLESIEENVLKTDGKAEEEELVIPMVQVDRAEIFRKLAEKHGKLEEDDDNTEKKEKDKEDGEAEDKVETKILTLDEQAEAALLEESKRKLEGWTDRGVQSNLTIAVAEETAKDAELYPVGKESSLDNYDEVQVDNFGAALLRGMGWKKTQGIGKKNKKVVDIIDPSAKTFGLMGSSLPGTKGDGEKKTAEEEELNLQKGSYVFIHSGRQRGTYGIVESLDEDHMLVKAAVSQAVLREVELNVRVVSQKEFKDSSRVINKEMYDKFKEEEMKKKQKKNKHSDDSESNDNKDTRKAKHSESRKVPKEEDIKREDIVNVKKEGEIIEKVHTKERDYAAKEKERSERRRDEDRSTGNYNKGSRYREDEEKESKYGGKDEKESNYRDEKESKYRDERESKYGGKNEKDRYRQDDNSKYREKYEKPDSSRENDRSKYNDEKGSSYKGTLEKQSRYRENDVQGKKYRESREYKERDGGYDSKYKSKYENSKARYKDEYIKNKYESADLNTSQKRRSKDDDYKYEVKKVKRSPERMPVVPWVRENLRVRLISKDYKGGKYHKEKVIVKTVITAESCECITAEGDILRKVHPEWLETVIPKIHPQIIMVVKGQQKGQRGRILQLHKDQEKASVQFLEDETVIMKLHYDDICEYVS
ncbi:G-patch domain and KOW motifs-containing protein-like [Penaeus japonicus]|uniref:G-patch domain and KOW motifs-containing protein-like n=1 Tax=Penaeus japonicus TaxID=27405 RepID=UPI001C716040|nr:G-patch domain and KOW motifs-containing protein-like [Penaeus japonicus]